MRKYTIQGFDHCEFYVGNAKQAVQYYRSLFGFQPVAYRGLETGHRESVSYVLKQNRIVLVLTSPYNKNSRIGKHLDAHGDGVKDVAFTVDNAAAAFQDAVDNGARAILEPTTHKDDNGRVVLSAIQTFGETVHTFVERNDYDGLFLPGFESWESEYDERESTGIIHIDHIVGNQPEGEMIPVVEWYENVLDFHRYWTVDDKDISTEYSALRSIVVANDNEKIKLPINEPAEGKKKSQIQEFVDYYHGAGVQHIAMSTRNIIDTVSDMRNRGVKFLDVPDTYYAELPDRVGEIEENIDTLRDLGILVDKDKNGYLLQIFTEPLQDRPTLFFEIIQRKGSNSFGKGNFKALFISIERAQERRGNL